jgi:hypothetical protein
LSSDPSATDPSPADPRRPSERLDQLEQALDDLRARLERIRAHLGAEIRTGRLVIVEGDGFERVVLDAGGHHGAVTVRARTSSTRSVAVEVVAADARDGDRAHVGVALLDAGDVVAAVDVQSGRPAMIWTPGGDVGSSPVTDPSRSGT